MKRKNWKVLAASALALGLGVSLFAGIHADADTLEKRNVASKTTGTTQSIKIKEVNIDLDDDFFDRSNVEIDFSHDLRWKQPAVTVEDEASNPYTAKIVERDEDDLELYVEELDYGHTYTFTISGVRRKNATSYGSVSFSIEIPNAVTSKNATVSSDVTVNVRSVEYDFEDKELDIEFRKRVVFQKDAEITITDESGKAYTARFIDKGKNDCEIRVRGLKRGETYNYTISGIRGTSDTSFGYASGSFVAYDD